MVHWLVANPVADFRPDRFDYAAEDRLIAAYLRAVEEVERIAPFERPPPFHIYAHPKKPGNQPDHKGR